MSEFLGVKIPINYWVILLLILAAIAIGAFLISSIALWIIRRVVPRAPTPMDDRVYRLVERYLFPLLMVAGLLVFVNSFSLPAKLLQVVNRSLIMAAVLLVIFLLAKGSLLLLRGVESHYEAIQHIRTPIETLTKIIFLAIGGMIVLDNLGISLTPIITTLGVGSLAVAIALQDTLGNFFAGLYIKADRPIKVGHYIRLESGQEGYVDHIGWRSTHIRALQNNIVVVPNSKLAQTIVINFHLPERRTALLIPIGVSYDSDPQAVEAIVTDEAKKAVGKIEGLLGDPEPFVRLIPGFGEFALDFTLICQVREFVDQYLVQHELRKRILKRFAQEGIQIPYRIQAAQAVVEPRERYRNIKERQLASGG